MAKKHYRHKSSKSSSDEIQISFTGIKEAIGNAWKKASGYKKYMNQTIIVVLLLAIILTASFTIRAQQQTLAVTDDWASQTVHGNIRQSIEQQIRAQQPNLPETAIRQRVDQEHNAMYQANKAEIDAQIQQLSQQYRAQLQDENGNTYQTGIDPWLFYSYAKWYLETGFFGDEIVDGEEVFSLRNGRIPRPAAFQWSVYPAIVTHRVYNVFTDADIMFTGFFQQTIMISIGIIFAFFLGRRLGGNNTAGFFSGALFAFFPAITMRTLESFDDDWVNLSLPIMIVFLVLVSLDSKEATWKRIASGIVAGLTAGYFSVSWGGWWFTFNLALGIIGLYFIYNLAYDWLFEKKRNIKKLEYVKYLKFAGIVFILFVVGAVAFLVGGKAVFDPTMDLGERVSAYVDAPLQPLSFIREFTAGAATFADDFPLWPSVFRTVAELRTSNMGEIYNNLAMRNSAGAVFVPGAIVLFLALAGIAALVLRWKEDRKYPFYALILLIWLGSTLYSALTGVRFHAFLGYTAVLCLAALIGWITGPAIKKMASWAESNTPTVKTVLHVSVIIIAVIFMVYPSMSTTSHMFRNSTPNFDDAWVDVMHLIRDSSEDAIITSWWDFGHFFQAVSDRRVTFDGGDQGRRIHWVGLSLLTDEEEEAVDILRMLNCGQEESYELLLEFTGSQIRATKLIKEITRLDREEARQSLSEAGLSGEEVSAVLEYSHCDDLIDNYVIVSGDMVGKAGVWGHFGGWNFTKAYAYYRLRNLPIDAAVNALVEDTRVSEEEAMVLARDSRMLVSEDAAVQWISPFPNYVTQQPSSCAEDNALIGCNYNVLIGRQFGVDTVLWRGVFNTSDYSQSYLLARGVDSATGAVVGQQMRVRPSAVVVAGEDGLERFELENPEFPYDVLLYYDAAGNPRTLIMDESLTKSVFTRLFFLNGAYTENFELVDDRTTFRGLRILTYKVNFG